MRKITTLLLLSILMLKFLTANAQYDPDKVCRIESGKIIFTLNLKWSDKEKKEISTLFELDSTLMARVYNGETTISIEGDIWKVVKLKSNLAELSKPLLSKSGKQEVKPDNVLFLMDRWMNFAGNDSEESVVYGVNKFEISNTFNYNNGIAWFYLAGNKSAGHVYISGSFNGWSTSMNPMKPVGSGWTVDLRLKPGKYTYKFIIDGKWIPDPYNNLREKDGTGGYNSVVYCPNHLFELRGSETARKVVVTGNFNNWVPAGLAMKKTDTGWNLPIYLRNGSYTYKFIVDNRWYTDPANPIERRDLQGNLNSVLDIGKPYLFKKEHFKEASNLFLAGNFNGWKMDELRMERTEKGWQIPYILPAGNYEYKFIVDGKWYTDPENPFTTGSGNTENSFLALKFNHLFELDNHADARSVIVSGSFNGWNKKEYRMIQKNGKWIFPLSLKDGKYTYKYIIDGKWIIDPANVLYEQNEYGTYNSVLWVEP